MTGSTPYFEIANPEIPEILRSMPRGLQVLDVGCGSGVHGAELKRIHGHHVFGVDLCVSSIAKASTRLAEAYVADVTHPELYPFYNRQKFDVIVFSDILEHLLDPLDVLTRHFALLAPGGLIVISLPNVAIWNVRLALLRGEFEYTDTGTLDRTHTRFFTRRSFARLVAAAHLNVHARRITPGLLRPFVPWIKKMYGFRGAADSPVACSSIMDSALYRFYMKWLYRLERAVCSVWPGLLAFQFVILAEPTGVAVNPDGVSPGLSELARELESQSVGALGERSPVNVTRVP